MSSGKGLIDRLAEMPKGKVIAIALVVVLLLGFLAVYFGFGLYKKPAEEDKASVVIDMPDPDTDEYNKSRLEAYQEADYQESFGSVTDSYWDSLGDELVSNPNGADDLDPSIYTAAEIYQIKHGLRTRADIDAEHAAAAARRAQLDAAFGGPPQSMAYPQQPSGYPAGAGLPAQPQMTQAQRDSQYFARIEKAYQIAAKYSAQAADQPSAPEKEEGPVEEERRIEITPPSLLPSESFEGDGIITSLVDESEGDVVHYAGTSRSKPVKATFLKNETLSNGQRVIIRLMQDFTLSNGTTIPANTHITGTCQFSSRLRINVTMLHYNGRMFPTDISVYDNDGTEGIYCPTVEQGGKKRKKAKQVASDVISSAGTLAGTLLTGNPFIGRVATSGLQAATSSVNDDGSVSVRVTAGYEFYVFENVSQDNG